MKHGAHESYVECRHVEPPSDRRFGITVGSILLGIAAVRWSFNLPVRLSIGFLVLGAMLLLFGLLVPKMLAPLNRAWMRLGLLMATIINPIVMFTIFAIAFVPLAIVMRLAGRDVLRVGKTAHASDYWRDRVETRSGATSLMDQF